MMMKVALLLLALAAPMITAGRCKKCPSCKCVKNFLEDKGVCDWPQESLLLDRKTRPPQCRECLDCKDVVNLAETLDCGCNKLGCKTTCKDAKAKLLSRNKKRHSNYQLLSKNRHCEADCPWLEQLGNQWGCLPKVPTYKTCDLYPNGYDYPCDSSCNYDGRDYGYGTNPKYYDICPTKHGKRIPDPYSYEKEGYVWGYGQKYLEHNLCPGGYIGTNLEEYKVYQERCGEKTIAPVYKTKECPPCETYACPTINYADCESNGYVPKHKYDDATLASSGETTNETVQTLSWVLIAIAAALFLASIAFCAVGRRERKAHAAENVHVNALA